MQRGAEVVAFQELPRTLEQFIWPPWPRCIMIKPNLKDELGLAWLVAWRELRDQLRDWRIISR